MAANIEWLFQLKFSSHSISLSIGTPYPTHCLIEVKSVGEVFSSAEDLSLKHFDFA